MLPGSELALKGTSRASSSNRITPRLHTAPQQQQQQRHRHEAEGSTRAPACECMCEQRPAPSPSLFLPYGLLSQISGEM